MWNMLHVTYLYPIIFRWLLGFWKNLCTPIEEDENTLSNYNSRRKRQRKNSDRAFI